MPTYTITQEQWNTTAPQTRTWKFRGATGPGQYAWNEADSRFEPLTHTTPAPSEQSSEQPGDFDGGFGIGGIRRYQPTAAEEMSLLGAQIQHAEREEQRVRRGPMPNGQLWEECERSGCHNEPVCVNCFYCEKHCTC